MHSHVSIPVQSEFVTGDLFTPEAKVSANMLFCHGWTSKNSKYIKLAQQLSTFGIQTLAINIRGHGDSIYPLENYSRQDHLDDIVAAIDYSNNRSTGKPFILLGKSYGGYLSAITTSLRKIDYLIISQPALYPDTDFNSSNAALIKRNPDVFRSGNESVSTNRALNAISRFDAPLLIDESEHDEEVFDIPKLYITASENNPKRQAITIKDTDHPLSRPEWLEDYYNQIIVWLRSQKILS
jgi:hypothetical protein